MPRQVGSALRSLRDVLALLRLFGPSALRGVMPAEGSRGDDFAVAELRLLEVGEEKTRVEAGAGRFELHGAATHIDLVGARVVAAAERVPRGDGFRAVGAGWIDVFPDALLRATGKTSPTEELAVLAFEPGAATGLVRDRSHFGARAGRIGWLRRIGAAFGVTRSSL